MNAPARIASAGARASFACAAVACMLAAVALQGCCAGRQDDHDAQAGTAAAPARPLALADWGPRETGAGVPFNVQPGGQAALWLRANQPLDGHAVLVQFGDAMLEAQVQGTLVTTVVPRAAYARPGRYPVRVIARFGASHRGSAPEWFTVE